MRTDALLLGRQLLQLFKVVKLFLWQCSDIMQTASVSAPPSHQSAHRLLSYRLIEELAEPLALLVKAESLGPFRLLSPRRSQTNVSFCESADECAGMGREQGRTAMAAAGCFQWLSAKRALLIGGSAERVRTENSVSLRLFSTRQGAFDPPSRRASTHAPQV